MRASRADIENALRTRVGAIALAARDLGLSRQALHQRIQRSDYLQGVLKDICETEKDIAEYSVKAEARKNVNVARWLLEQTAPERGYGRGVTTAPEAAPIDFEKALESLDAKQLAFLRSIQAAGRPRRRRHG